MKFFLISILLILSILSACNLPQSGDSTQANDTASNTEQSSPIPDKTEKIVITEGWQQYTNNAFHFSLQYPPQWRVVEENIASNMHIINVYSTRHEDKIDLPLTVHADAAVTHVSIFPEGWGTELPSGTAQKLREVQTQLPVNFGINKAKSTLFSLENGAVWGYFIIPASLPAGWSDEGYLFAQIAVDNFQAKCFDKQTEEEKQMRNCDPLTGDQVKRYGTLNQQAQAQVRKILASLQFSKKENKPQAASDLIQVENPSPNADIRSPLTVKGQARGTWYFEGEFQIQLKDKDDKVLARTPAVAQDTWMTKDFVPFEAILRFDAPGDERGKLVFQKANPSGKPEHENSFTLPVIFPPD